MLRHKVTFVMAASLAGALGVVGTALAAGAAADGHGAGQRSVVVVRGAAAGNGHSFDGGVRAGPSSESAATGGGGGQGGSGGDGGDVARVTGQGDAGFAWNGGGRGGGAGAGGAGDAGGAARSDSEARGGGNAASQSSVNNSGNSANTNVISANVQVNSNISARNDSANVVIGDNENVSGNENDNDADADADARAGNANLNINAGVSDLTNSNTSENSNTSTNTGTNTNGPASPGLCASFGGSFTFVGSPFVLWTCNDLPDLPQPERNARFETMFSACIAEGGRGLESNSTIPEDLTCLVQV